MFVSISRFNFGDRAESSITILYFRHLRLTLRRIFALTWLIFRFRGNSKNRRSKVSLLHGAMERI